MQKMLIGVFALVGLFGSSAQALPPLPQPRPSFAPIPRPGVPQVRVIEARAANSAGTFSQLYVGGKFFYTLEITALQTDFVKVEMDEDAYVENVLSLDVPMAGVPPRPFRGFPVNAQGKAIAEFGARLKQDLSFRTGPYPVALIVTTVRAGVDTRHRVRLPDLQFTGLKRFTQRRTADIADRLSFELYVSPQPVAWTCEGTSTGSAGSFPVGIDEDQGDIRFRIRSGPAGTHCMWEAQQNLNARPNWQIEALNFVSNSTGPCFIGGNDTDRDRAPPTGGTIRHDHVFVGKFARIELSRLSQPSHVFPTMHVALECPITGTNDRFAVVRWDSVELIGPEDETVGQAF